MFEIARSTELFTMWYPVANSNTLYVGQLVDTKPGDSVDYLIPLATSSGTPDTDKALGVVVATNNKTATYSSTYKADYIAGIQTQSAQLARSWQGAQGCMWGVGDPIPLVQVKLIGPQTSVKGSIFSSTFGTALSTFSPSTNSSTGSQITIAEASASAVAYNTIFYCRSGANKGIYRVCTTVANSANVTTCDFATYFPYSISTTDVFVKANLRPGLSKVFINTGLFIDGANALSKYHTVFVEEINLATSGKEYAVIRFV